MPNFNVADAKRTPQIVIRDGRGDVVTVVTPRDLQVGFEGSPGTLILKGALDINAYVLQLTNPTDAASVIVTNDKIAYFILNDSNSTCTVKLPTPPGGQGQTHIIKDYRGSASDTTPISIVTQDGSTIDGFPSLDIVVPYGAIMFVWTGRGWVSLALGASGAGGGAPNSAKFVVWGTEVGLSNSRVLSVTTGHLTLNTTAPNANIGLPSLGVPGTFTYPSQITVDTQGRVTSITSTTGSVSSDPGAQYVVMALTSSLSNERVATQGTGIRIVDGGANGPVTWSINDNVVATISGSNFTGVTKHSLGLSGSLTQLSDGRSYIVAGNNITVTSASNGQVTIASTGASSSIDAPINATYLTLTADGTLTAERIFTPGTGLRATDGGAGAAYTLFINDSVVATISGSTFSGVTRHTAGLSGSLTQLTTGVSYLVAGANIVITSASNGQITISSTATGSFTGSGGTGTGDNGASYVVLGLTASLSNERVLTAGTGISIVDNGANGTVVVGLTGASSQSADVYNGYCTGSLQWTATSWTDFMTVPGNFSDSLQNGIIRSGSTFSVSKDGYYHFHSFFNIAVAGTYVGWRLSGSNGTLIQRTSYCDTSSDSVPAILQGVFQLSSGSSFKLQYALKSAVGANYTVSDPLDGENMRSGEISIFRVADPITINTGSGGGTGTGDNGATYVVMSATASLANERVLTAGTGISIVDGGAGGPVTIGLAGTTSQSADVYDGFTSGSLGWGNNTSWTDFTNVATGFQDRIVNNISRSASTWTVSKAGYYSWHSDFNFSISNGYLAFRLSGSSGTLIQQTSYDDAGSAVGNGRLDGIIFLNSGSSFKLQYVRKLNTAGTWGVTDPIDGENMVTGRISVFRIIDPLVINQNITNVVTSTNRFDSDSNDIIVWRLTELSGARIVNFGTSGSAADLTGSSRLVYGRAGIYDSAIDFRGIDTPTFASGGSGIKPKDYDFTVSAWIYPYQFLTGVAVIKNYTTGTYVQQSPIILGVTGSFGQPFVQLRTTVSAANLLIIDESRSLNVYNWNHFGFTLSGTGGPTGQPVARFYVNGDFVKSMTISGSIDYSGNGWWSVGGIPSSGEQSGDYKLNEIRIANAIRNDQWWRDIYLRGLRGTSGGASQAYVTGTWRDAVNTFVTTGSVSIDSQNRTVAQVGSDIFFFVSGSVDQTGAGAKNSLFGGDTYFSGAVVYLGGMIYNTTTVTGSYFISRDDYIVGVNQPNGSSSIIFTPTGSIRQGRAYKIIDIAGNSATGSITISGSAGSLILGSSTYLLAINWSAIELIRLGNNWIIG